MISLLDRYLFTKTLFNLLMVTSALVVFILGLGAVFNSGKMFESALQEDQSRWVLIATLSLLRIPAIIHVTLPLTMLSAALMTCSPMIRRNEYIALSASGFSMQRIARAFIWLACLCGLVQYGIANHLNPVIHNYTEYVETALGVTPPSQRTWVCTDTKSVWFTAHSRVFNGEAPSFSHVFVATDDGQMLFADGMHWHTEQQQWVFTGPIVHWTMRSSGNAMPLSQHQQNPPQPQQQTQPQQDRVRHLSTFPVTGAFALNYSDQGIEKLLLSRDALTGSQLMHSGEHMHTSLLLSRCLTFFAPLLALCYGLPCLVRFHNRETLLIASSKALACGAVPVLLLASTGSLADEIAWSPWLSSCLGLLLATLPAVVFYKKWTY